MPAIVHDTEDTKNRMKPQPDMGRFSAIRAAPATPNTVPAHFAKLIVAGIYTERFRVCPALKRTDFEALMRMASPVNGLRPLRAARLAMLNVPKPTS